MRVGKLLASACLLAIGSTNLVGIATGSETQRLREVTEKWRSARGTEQSIEVFLRPVVAEDPHFSRDPGLALDQLSPEMRDHFDSLQYFLTATLKAQFVGLSSDELRQEWLRRYWRLRDPTPTTPENERQLEHERRVDHAKREFAWKERPFWDARGRVYIMFGAPDSIVSEPADVREGVGYVPATEEWRYDEERWIAEFQRPNPRGPWVFGNSSPALSSRPDLVQEDLRRLGYTDMFNASTASGRERMQDLLGQRDDRLLIAKEDPERLLSREIAQTEVRGNLQARDQLRRRAEAVRSFTKELEAGNDRFVISTQAKRSLWYVFDVDVFKGPPGRMRVEVHYQFNMQDLTFSWQDSAYVARYRMEGILLDGNVRVAARDEYVETLTASEFRSTVAAKLLPGQLNFVVPPGRYRLNMRFVDLKTHDEGVYITDVEVPNLGQTALAISDIQMASRIVYAGDDWKSRFVKNDRLVVPNPIGVYRRQAQLTGYFEIYGLQFGDDEISRYQVTYSIRPRGLVRADGWFPDAELVEKPFVTSSFTGEAGSEELVEELRVDIGSLEQDSYDLVLTVRDLVAGTEATSRTAFSVLD